MVDDLEIRRFFEVLVDDCSTAARFWSEHDNGYTRRSYVRAFFAFVEGNTYRMKQICVYAHNNGHIQLSPKDFQYAMEMTQDDDGNEKIIKIDVLKNIKRSFKLFSKVFNVASSLDTSGIEWEKFGKALNIRHRLAHPKSSTDLELCFDDMTIIESATQFYREATIRLISHSSRSGNA